MTFLGYLRGEALHESIRLSRAVVLPSEGYENAPVSLMESYALGKPVIGADIGGIPELIREGETGVTFTSGSVDLLADRLRRFAESPDSRLVDMGRQGRMWMEQNFTTSHYLNRVLGLYRELALQYGRPRPCPEFRENISVYRRIDRVNDRRKKRSFVSHVLGELPQLLQRSFITVLDKRLYLGSGRGRKPSGLLPDRLVFSGDLLLYGRKVYGPVLGFPIEAFVCL